MGVTQFVRFVVPFAGLFILTVASVKASPENQQKLFGIPFPDHTWNTIFNTQPISSEGASKACLPAVKAEHLTVYCTEPSVLEQLPIPLLAEGCVPVISMTHEDERFELNSKDCGFKGYFDPSRWKVVTIKGGGGVDVTGAPNALLVEGADNTALIDVLPGSEIHLQMIAPADGYVTFDWRRVGGSNIFAGAVSVRVNGCTTLLEREGGRFCSPLLHAGDQLAIELVSSTATNLQLAISQFRFLTNAIGVIERTWKTTDMQSHSFSVRQLITIERSSIDHILFPANIGTFNVPLSSTSPEYTGFPVVDQDGDPLTNSDQFRLDETNCGFDVKWEDELFFEKDLTIVYRHWTILDRYAGNSITATQLIPLAKSCTEEGKHGDF